MFKLTDREKTIAEIINTLNDCQDYFDDKADADHDGEGFVANKEMKLLASVKAAIADLKNLTSE